MSKKVLKKMKSYKLTLNQIESFLLEDEHEKLATITHYLQNKNTPAESNYKKEAISLLPPSFQDDLFKWDVPFPPPENHKFTFIDLFAGIGGMRIAFQNLGGKCLFTSEWDAAAQVSYKENFGEMPFGDITKIDENNIPNHDLLIAGFPCQPFSIIGKRRGFEDIRGSLFFDIARILKAKKPKAFVLENVKQLVGHRKGETFSTIISVLKKLNYKVVYKVLNALDYGLPQKRERVIIVGTKTNFDFEWPEKINKYKPLSEILEKKVDNKHFVSEKILNKRKNSHNSSYEISIWHENKSGHISSYQYSCALRAGASYNYLLVNGERRLTAREMLRLQGFPDKFIIAVPDAQIRKQAGNSVPVNMIFSVGKNVIKYFE